MDQVSKPRQSFDDWYKELQKLGYAADFPIADQESFREMYNDGHTPEEALQSELDAV